jgi:hypothetical protein
MRPLAIAGRFYCAATAVSYRSAEAADLVRELHTGMEVNITL